MTNKIINIAVASGLALMYKNKIAGGKATVVNRQKNPSENAINYIDELTKNVKDSVNSSKMTDRDVQRVRLKIDELELLKIQIERNDMIVNGCIEPIKISFIRWDAVNFADLAINNNDDAIKRGEFRAAILDMNRNNDGWMKANAMQLNSIDFESNIKRLIGFYKEPQSEYPLAAIQQHTKKLNLISHRATRIRGSYNSGSYNIGSYNIGSYNIGSYNRCSAANIINLPIDEQYYLIDGKKPTAIQDIISSIIENGKEINKEINKNSN